MFKAKYLVAGCTGLLVLGLGSAAHAEFTGGYVGGAAGLFTSTTVEESGPGFENTFGLEDNILTKLDIIAGYGIQQGQAYYGFEGQYTLTHNVDGTIFSDRGGSDELELGDGYTLAARLGFVPQDGLLIYAKLAYAERNYELSGVVVDADEDFSGIGIGVGVEYLATDNVSVRLEGMRYDYDDENPFDAPFDGNDVDPVEQTVDLMAVYRF